MYPVYWLIAVAVFLLIEIATLGLTSIWFAGGAIAAAILAGVGAPFYAQVILWILVSLSLFLVTRPIAQKYFNGKTEKTNAESLIGETAIVKETIENVQGKGIVFINGMDWSAKSTEIDVVISEGTEVIVEEIRGVNLIVKEK
ncbi:MAG: NfeD family protein [Anaerostipes sp.]|jgi:membrane protein implicated in regulation of membrane protease activity|nr:NfeD family protein [Anaerostipes sp.]MDD3747196.1 NfeD family protein [Anaerostipes sp.]MDD4371523.1 NfeD family protein [Anaerostipes sp.]